MDSREAQLRRVGKRVRDVLDAEAARGEDVRLGRARFVEHVTARNLRPTPRRGLALGRRVGVGVLALGAAAAATLFWVRRPISFQIGSQIDAEGGLAAVVGNAGDRIEASPLAPTALRFSDGSSIVLERGGRMRVLTLAPDGARVLVEKGEADVAIAHPRAPRRWRFEAGPVTVDVTGTRFHLGWSPERRSFEIDLKEGSVVVGGDCLPLPRRVQRGEHLHVSCVPAAETATTAVGPSALEPARAAPLKPAVVRTAQALPSRELHAAEAGDWRALVAAGHYAEGVAAAGRVGWSRVSRTANAVDLLALADAARLSGQTSRAVELLSVLRQRFPGSTSAATGAFSLGRLAFEERHAYRDAARWFATYLDEQPSGPLMGDAFGRLMEAHDRSGDRAAARRDAQAYLQRFPGGPYAGMARLIVTD